MVLESSITIFFLLLFFWRGRGMDFFYFVVLWLGSAGFRFQKYKTRFLLRKYTESFPFRKYTNFFNIRARKFHFLKYKEFLGVFGLRLRKCAMQQHNILLVSQYYNISYIGTIIPDIKQKEMKYLLNIAIIITNIIISTLLLLSLLALLLFMFFIVAEN